MWYSSKAGAGAVAWGCCCCANEIDALSSTAATKRRPVLTCAFFIFVSLRKNFVRLHFVSGSLGLELQGLGIVAVHHRSRNVPIARRVVASGFGEELVIQNQTGDLLLGENVGPVFPQPFRLVISFSRFDFDGCDAPDRTVGRVSVLRHRRSAFFRKSCLGSRLFGIFIRSVVANHLTEQPSISISTQAALLEVVGQF